jgi:hypothetical protein
MFDRFWAAYPRKVGKGEARKVWMRLRPSVSLVEKMLKTLAWQAETEQWRRDDGQFIPHPATWLRQERWDDEPVRVVPPDRRVTGRESAAAYALRSAREFSQAIDEAEATFAPKLEKP